MNNDPRITQLFAYLSTNQLPHINRQAFDDIAECLLSFHDKHNESEVKEVLEALPGHGKSTVLISYCKWILANSIDISLLICTKEKHLAHDIYKEISSIKPNAVINLDSDNKDLYENDLRNKQIVIIQQQRLKNLALGFGIPSNYTNYKPNKCDKPVKRLMIIDEKPDFIDSVIFDINSINNALDWFEDLAEPLNLKLTPIKLQMYKSYIMFLISSQLCKHSLDRTMALTYYHNDEETTKGLISLLDEMKEHKANQFKYDSLNTMKHFINLLQVDEYGRIDEYWFNNIGRKIIISKYIDYGILGMNILILDGTMRANSIQYTRGNYRGHRLENRNDYSRLNYHIEEISTSKHSRSKENYTTQKTISERIKELQKDHKDLFVLPMKDEIDIYINTGAINQVHRNLYFDNKSEQTKGINLLNTLGKNILNDKKSLYLTCLPKKNADYYKCIAIAIYGTDVNLMMNKDSSKGQWFRDDQLEEVYKGELISELMQIIHRTSLRKVNSNDEINVYIAYDEEKERLYFDDYTLYPISNHINNLFMDNEMVIHHPTTLINMADYGHIEKIKEFIKQIENAFKKDKRVKKLRISKVSNSFQVYINKHWNDKSSQINLILNEYGYKLSVQKDRYSNDSKYILKV